MDWLFHIKNLKEAMNFYKLNGFVGFLDALTHEDVINLRNGFDEAVQNGSIVQSDEKMINGNDAIFRHVVFEKYLYHPNIIKIAQESLARKKGLVLQHSKLNSKPLKDKGEGLIDWHQDYPFFPHTNLDLVAVGIHFDDENIDSGSMRVIPGSHLWGIHSHCDKNGEFMYRATANLDQTAKSVLLTCPAGTVTVHHCLTYHQSAPKKNNRQRRFLVYQIRCDDNIQLSGVIWKSTGIEITEPSEYKGMVRFMDGTLIENRGKEGRLYDIYSKLAPNK